MRGEFELVSKTHTLILIMMVQLLYISLSHVNSGRASSGLMVSKRETAIIVIYHICLAGHALQTRR